MGDDLLVKIIQQINTSKELNQPATVSIKVNRATKEVLESGCKILLSKGIKIPIGHYIYANALISEQSRDIVSNISVIKELEETKAKLQKAKQSASQWENAFKKAYVKCQELEKQLSKKVIMN